MPNVAVRILSGLFYGIMVLWATFSGESGQIILACFLSVGAVLEWLWFQKDGRVFLAAVLINAIIFLSIFIFTDAFLLWPQLLQWLRGLLILLIASLLITQAFSHQKVLEKLFHRSFALIYIGFPMLLLPMMSNFKGENQPWMLGSVFILIWCNDTFAYFLGKYFGKRKLFPRISPNKTWEGFLGGVIGTIVASIVFHWLFPFITWSGWLGLAFVVLIFGTIGDLFESALKRAYNIKDSGKFLPGHGGILDRIDSLLFALPMAYFYLRIIENLQV